MFLFEEPILFGVYLIIRVFISNTALVCLLAESIMALTCHPAITVVGLTLAASLLVSQPGASAHKMKTYTFLQAEQPFLEYHLEWTNARHVRIEFEFRTQKANSFLLHHTLMHAITNEKPQLWATLNQGQLNVTHVYGAYRESLIVAKGECSVCDIVPSSHLL